VLGNYLRPETGDYGYRMVGTHDTEGDVIGILENTLRKIPDLTLSNPARPSVSLPAPVRDWLLGLMREIVLFVLKGSAHMPVVFRECWLW